MCSIQNDVVDVELKVKVAGRKYYVPLHLILALLRGLSYNIPLIFIPVLDFAPSFLLNERREGERERGKLQNPKALQFQTI